MTSKLQKLLVISIYLFAPASLIAAPQAPTVVVDDVQELPIAEPISFNGYVRSQHDISLPSTVDGELLWVREEGDVIQAGDVVAKTDDRALKLQRAEQVLSLGRSEINFDYLTGEVARLQKLQAANLTAKNLLAEMISRKNLAKNDMEVARIKIAQLDETLARTEIRSPVNAIVVERLKIGGEFSRRGETILRLLDPDALEVLVQVPVAYYQKLDQKRSVHIRVQGASFEAPLKAVMLASDMASQTFNLLVHVPVEESNFLVAGQFADAMLVLKGQSDALFVPRDALVIRSDGNYVFKLGADNKVEKIAVLLGDGQGALVSVQGALSKGDQVAVRGVERLTDGQEVLPMS